MNLFGERFRDVSTVLPVSCLLFFYSRCPRAQSFEKVGAHARAPRAPWSRRHCPEPLSSAEVDCQKKFRLTSRHRLDAKLRVFLRLRGEHDPPSAAAILVRISVDAHLRVSAHTNLQLQLRTSSCLVLCALDRLLYISPVLRQLHWLPVRQRLTFKLAVLVLKALYTA